MCSCIHVCMHLCVCVYFLFHHLHITAQTSCSARGFRSTSQLQQQHHRSLQKSCPARSEIIMGVKQAHFERLLVPSSYSPGHSLCLHLTTSQPWLPFPASFVECSFCFVQVVAGGGRGVVRSSYSQKRRSVPAKYYHGEHMH